MTRPSLVVVGGSARAAVGSAERAGFDAAAVDPFGDRDTRQLAAAFALCPFEDYPEHLPELLAAFPLGPVLYTGGLETHPSVVARLAAARPLWGNTAAALAVVRDPFRVTDVLTRAGLPTPQVLPATTAPPFGSRWLRKNPRLSGGLGVRFAIAHDEPLRPGEYLQEFVDGPAMSALFVADANGVTTVGVTDQLIGESWLHARGFAYCGNVGPVAVPPSLAADLHAAADAVRSAAGLRGVFGLDFVLRDGRPWVVEVNPRYTAAVEVLEHGTGVAAIARHAAAFGAAVSLAGGVGVGVVGKAVYFAPRRIVFPPAGPWDDDLGRPFDPWRVPGYADIPHPGEVVDDGRPVLTVFAVGPTPAAVRTALVGRAAELDERFGG